MRDASSYGALLDALRGVTWPARRAMRGATAGSHRSRMRGVSPEFSEYRPYRQGDDPRQLDWRLLARTDRAYMRLMSDRATLATLIVVDGSASMAYPARTLTKWAHARLLAVGLAGVAHASGDPVGLTVVSESRAAMLEPRTRRGVVAECARLLDHVTPSGGSALAHIIASARSPRRIVIISDFLGDADATLAAARAQIYAGTEMQAVHVAAREELDPRREAMLATDPELPEIRRALVDETREGYLVAFASFRERQAAAWRAAGCAYDFSVADERADRAVRRITGARRDAAGYEP